MAKKFDDIQVGDQLELTRGNSGSYLIATGTHNRDPNTVARVAIVTHIWFDPVDNKEYAGIAYLKRDGSHGKPTEKRTLTGLARCGWRKAQRDWIEHLQQNHARRDDKVISLWGRS